MYVGSEQCSYFAYFEQSTEHRYIISIKGDPSELHSGSRPHPGRRQSQYSWAHMDPSAHSLAFRGGAEVPDEEYEVQNLYTEDAQGGDTEMYRAANRYMLGAASEAEIATRTDT